MVYSNCHCSSHFLFFLFMITWWPSAGKDLSSWLSACAVWHRNCLCSFSVWCRGQNVEFDCIGFWSLPFHLLHSLPFPSTLVDLTMPVSQTWHRLHTVRFHYLRGAVQYIKINY